MWRKEWLRLHKAVLDYLSISLSELSQHVEFLKNDKIIKELEI